jgi:ADP-ribosylglycohydrolase
VISTIRQLLKRFGIDIRSAAIWIVQIPEGSSADQFQVLFATFGLRAYGSETIPVRPSGRSGLPAPRNLGKQTDTSLTITSAGTVQAGITVSTALLKYTETGDPFAGSVDPRSAGNGSLMRLAPVPLAYRENLDRAIHYAGESSRTTHGAPAAVDACKFYTALILGALKGWSKEDLLRPDFYQGSLVPEIAEIAAGSYREKNPPQIVGTGYVVKSLEAALWAFYRSSTFERGALLAGNLGNDADTTAAVFGQLAGAFYGAEAIPHGWLAKLAMREFITEMADSLGAISESQ